jgi:DNA-cytosine methyltransferase
MNILSLFDGVSCARVALERAGIKINKYFSSEIDRFSIKIAQKNYPDTVQLGDIKEIDCTGGKLHYGMGRLAETDIDLIIGGSPCQDLSIAKKDRRGLDGERSGLFWEYVRILKEVKPKYFILENVNSMPKEAKQVITETLGRYLYPEEEWDIVA